ncbi:hypothetical protein D3C72_2072610 [compost metagenome]
MLQQRFGHDDIADFHVFIPTAGHAGEDDVGNSVLFHKDRSCHGSSNLAQTRQDAHSVDIPQGSQGVVAHAVRTPLGALHGFYQPLLFFVQGTDDA